MLRNPRVVIWHKSYFKKERKKGRLKNEFYLQVCDGNAQLGAVISSQAPHCAISAFLFYCSICQSTLSSAFSLRRWESCGQPTRCDEIWSQTVKAATFWYWVSALYDSQTTLKILPYISSSSVIIIILIREIKTAAFSWIHLIDSTTEQHWTVMWVHCGAERISQIPTWLQGRLYFLAKKIPNICWFQFLLLPVWHHSKLELFPWTTSNLETSSWILNGQNKWGIHWDKSQNENNRLSQL